MIINSLKYSLSKDHEYNICWFKLSKSGLVNFYGGKNEKIVSYSV